MPQFRNAASSFTDRELNIQFYGLAGPGRTHGSEPLALGSRQPTS